jgi:hypothetical protein
VYSFTLKMVMMRPVHIMLNSNTFVGRKSLKSACGGTATFVSTAGAVVAIALEKI